MVSCAPKASRLLHPYRSDEMSLQLTSHMQVGNVLSSDALDSQDGVSAWEYGQQFRSSHCKQYTKPDSGMSGRRWCEFQDDQGGYHKYGDFHGVSRLPNKTAGNRTWPLLVPMNLKSEEQDTI